MLNLDNIFGIHATALALHSRRAEILAGNLANADTPNYQARDIDFKAVLNGASDGLLPLQRSDVQHLAGSGEVAGGTLQYRIPQQPSIDGNTVDTQLEKSEFLKNAMQYQASLRFLNGRISSLKLAISGQ